MIGDMDKPATREWAVKTFGAKNTGSLYQGHEWCPQILNPIDRRFIELRRQVTRNEMIVVFEAYGGEVQEQS